MKYKKYGENDEGGIGKKNTTYTIQQKNAAHHNH